MKKIFNIILVIFTCHIFFGCEDQPMLFNDEDALYFGTTDTLLAYSFAKYPKRVSDTLQIPLQVLGNATDQDRTLAFEVLPTVDGKPAVEGQHYKIPNQGIIKANNVTGSLTVIIYRTSDLEEGATVSFILKIKPNEDFQTIGIAKNQKLRINLAYLQKPASWGEFTGAITGFFAGYNTNFGTWTPTKYKVVLDALYDEKTETTVTEFPGSRFSPPILYNQYVAIVRNYIKTNYPGNYGLAGPKLTDPDNDNLPIQVGPANY